MNNNTKYTKKIEIKKIIANNINTTSELNKAVFFNLELIKQYMSIIKKIIVLVKNKNQKKN